MRLNKLPVDIILPPDLAEASASALKLCELFIESLIKSKEKLINLSVDLPTKAVRCNDSVVKEVVRLFIGSGRFEEFVRQQVLLLHKSTSTELLGELHYIHEGVLCKFVFSGSMEKAGWQITQS